MWIYFVFGIIFAYPQVVTPEFSKDIFNCSGINSVNEFRCFNGDGCVDAKLMCDGVQHCLDGSDEEYCSLGRSIPVFPNSTLSRSKRQQSSCGSDQWQCRDGSCISLDNICNGVADCTDRSDETHPFCKKLLSSTKTGGCILPPYPTNGIYEVSKFPDAKPSQALDSFVLTISCRKGFGVVNPSGDEGSGTQQLYCVNGEYQYKNMPRCVRFCKLNPDPSVRYTCHVPGVGFKTCPHYVPPGTLVNPICNSPIYYSIETNLPYMKCNFGFWDYVAQCRAECGRVTPEGGELIIDGKQARRGELPWHVGVYRKTTSPYTQICGGTLITNNVVLSAAHCFWNDLRRKLPASEFAVAIGKLYRDWDSEYDVGAQKSDLLDIRIPSRFLGAAANFQEDIAALVLKTPFVYMTYVRPVCVYYDANFERIQLQQGNSGKVAGWGLTAANGPAADTLQVLELPFVNVDTCINTLPPSFSEYITGDKFCAGYTNGKALCKGDSGGGLAFPDRGLGVDRYYLRGIVSAAPRDDQKQCNDYAYTTFTMITKHQDFIKESLAASAEKRCPQYSFQCDDGSCVDQGSDCNNIQDCADGSDESEELCKPGYMKPITVPEPSPLAIPSIRPQTSPGLNTLNTNSNTCVLPEFPPHATYQADYRLEVPTQKINGVTLTVTCYPGYGIKSPEDGASINSTTVSCNKGQWLQPMPTCVRVCRLAFDDTIDPKYTCWSPQDNIFKCTDYVQSGTSVSVKCNRGDYYSDNPLPPVRCVAGSWDYLPRCKGECGRVQGNRQTVYLEGSPTERGALPWHVGIHRKTPRPYTQICGGSLVSTKLVISAAHCFWKNKALPASDFAVVAGKFYRAWSDVRDQYAQKSDIKEIKVPNNFRGFQDDIAIVLLTSPFVYTFFVKAVCMDFDFDLERLQLKDGALGQIGGWGKSSANGKFSPVIKEMKLQYINLAQCRSKITITEDKICAGFQNETSKLCDGDGGGGLAFPAITGQNVERFFLRGVLSRPTNSENICNGAPYNVFTSISKHEEIIKRYL